MKFDSTINSAPYDESWGIRDVYLYYTNEYNMVKVKFLPDEDKIVYIYDKNLTIFD